MAAGAAAPQDCVFQNELPGFKFCAKARWRELRPMVSTVADVRRVLGTPTEESDMAHYGDPYPGDAKAVAPELTFDDGPDWEILVHLARSGARAREFDPSVPARLLSIDLVPKHRRSFANVTFPASFRKRHVNAEGAAWDEYADGSGLVYEVYTTPTLYGDEQPGDLSRISYGASDQLKIQHGKR
jgi:hypothetical protein